MIKPFLIFVSLLPLSLFSQDTLFNQRLSEITVKSVAKKESNISVINIVKNNSVVSDGISIEYLKKTPDRTVGDALKRVNGVTIQNDRFVLVRGLADRYNSAMLNKTVLPSTEPDRRAFSFDIIPSSLIDNIIVAKSAAANLPGDFSGGLVQVTTKDVSGNFLNVSLGSGWGLVSTSKGFKLVQDTKFPSTFPSTYKFRVGSLGDRRAYTKLINSYDPRNFTSSPNYNGAISFGIKKNKWNVLFSSTGRRSYSLNYTDRLDYQSSTELAYKYKDTSYTTTESLNTLLNITYIGKYKYSLKTLFNHQVEQSYLTRFGENYDNVQDVKSTSSNKIVKTVVNSQFDTKIKTIDFNVGYNLMLRDQPDYRVNPITKSLGSNQNYSIAWRDTYRFWSIMNENSFNTGLNKEFKNIKVGATYLKKMRQFQARVFRYEASDLMNEITNNTDRYKANFDLATGYFMYDKEFGDWKLNTGLRTEYNIFNVNTADFSGQKVNVDRTYLDFLPSLNVSKTVDRIKKRFSISKTLARPEFREVANFAYYDFVRNAQLLGNSKLEKSDVYNIDLKWEYYPKTGETVSVGVFAKQFIKPIEQIVADGSVPSNLLLTYTNPDKASLYGIEIEVRKKMTEWLDFYANTSLMTSEVNVNGSKRQLQGQSNYIVNGGLNLHKKSNTLNITYNRVGDRISAVGFQGYSDIFENSRDVVDVVYLRKIKKGEVKLAVSDILAQPSKYYQKNRGDLIKTNNEQTISLTLNLNL
jgi:outer membrane receptor protein involved in Fe transport